MGKIQNTIQKKDLILKMGNPEDVNALIDLISEKVINAITPIVRKGIQGDKGDKGNEGKTPQRGIDYMTENEIKEMMKRMQKEVQNKIRIPKNGIDGHTPIKGIDYFDGKDGSSDKPEDIVKKLNTLQEILELDVLKGLKEFIIKNIPRAKSGGGSGMGNVIHQQFSGNGSTTVFTLSNNVAGNGNAVIGCRYEGQMQYLGDQFTISGKTLTMTFTPENNTKIEITYIRSS